MEQITVEDFLSKLYNTQESGADITSIVLRQFFNTPDLKLMNDTLTKVDLSKIDRIGIIALFTSSFKYSVQLPEYFPFIKRVEEYLTEKGESQERIDRTLNRFRDGAGNYWENMKSLGAPEWLSGKRPE